MAVRVNKDAFNIRDKLSELAVKFGLKGSELARAETVQDARDLVSAGRKNKIINGSMIIDQRHSGSSHTDSNAFHTDRFRTQVSGADQLVQTYQQVADGPTGFAYSLKVTTTTPETAIEADEYLAFYHKMEGYNLQDLSYGTSNPQQITISFYVKSSITGTFGYAIYRQEAAGDRHINFTYTINSPNVWERKSITIPGDTVRAISNTSISGPWWNVWHLAAGTTYIGSTTTGWESYASDKWVGYEISNEVCTTNGATWQITGVQLEVGKNATDFEHRPYGEELALCQRYFTRLYFPNSAYVAQGGLQNSSNIRGAMIYLPTTLRLVPSTSNITSSGTGNGTGLFTFLQPSTANPVTVGTITMSGVTDSHIHVYGTNFTSIGSVGQTSQFYAGGGAWINIDVEI